MIVLDTTVLVYANAPSIGSGNRAER